jgi:HD-like signal output (HDOD) protein
VSTEIGSSTLHSSTDPNSRSAAADSSVPAAATKLKSEQVREIVIRSLDRLPAFSTSLSQLLALMARGDVQISELASCIEKDALLTGHVLRVVNSAAYSLRREVTSVAHACSMMGLYRLRNIAISLSISDHWKRFRLPHYWSQKRFNNHGIAVALLADRLALETMVPESESCFLAGLLHDIGKLLMASAHPTAFEALTVFCQQNNVPAALVERQFYGIDHAELSGLALEKWRVRPMVAYLAKVHHQPKLLDPDIGLSAAVVLAHSNRFINQIGLSVLSPLGSVSWEPLPFSEYGGNELDGLDMESIMTEFRQDLEAVLETGNN